MKKIFLIYVSLVAIPGYSAAAYNPAVNQEEEIDLRPLSPGEIILLENSDFNSTNQQESTFELLQNEVPLNQETTLQQQSSQPDPTTFLFNFNFDDDDASTPSEEPTSYSHNQASSSMPLYNSQAHQSNLNNNFFYAQNSTLTPHSLAQGDMRALQLPYPSDKLITRHPHSLHVQASSSTASYDSQSAQENQPKNILPILEESKIWKFQDNYYYQCSCGKYNPKTRNSRTYRYHINTFHSTLLDQIENAKKTNRECELCGTPFSNFDGFSSHRPHCPKIKKFDGFLYHQKEKEEVSKQTSVLSTTKDPSNEGFSMFNETIYGIPVKTIICAPALFHQD